MRVSKKALRPFAVILVSLSMSALLTGARPPQTAHRRQSGFGWQKALSSNRPPTLQFGDE